MPRTPRPALILTALAALLLGAGCTTAVPGVAAPDGAAPPAPTSATSPRTTGSGEPDAAAVAWVDEMCGALLPFVRTASTPPSLDSSGDPAALVQGFSAYLGQASGSADGAIRGMEAVGPSPVAGGDEIVTRLTETLTTLRTSFRNAKDRIDAIDTSDPQALATGLPAALGPLRSLASLPNPTTDLQSSPELERAATQAPNCQQVEKTAG